MPLISQIVISSFELVSFFAIFLLVLILQRCKPCQDKAVEQTFVVDNSRLVSFAVGYIAVNE
jgi:hypothetical protein